MHPLGMSHAFNTQHSLQHFPVKYFCYNLISHQHCFHYFHLCNLTCNLPRLVTCITAVTAQQLCHTTALALCKGDTDSTTAILHCTKAENYGTPAKTRKGTGNSLKSQLQTVIPVQVGTWGPKVTITKGIVLHNQIWEKVQYIRDIWNNTKCHLATYWLVGIWDFSFFFFSLFWVFPYSVSS